MRVSKLFHKYYVFSGKRTPLRIAFLGQMRSGKDTAASYLIQKYGGVNLKFTDPLYAIQKAIYKIIHRPEPEKDRRLLQLVGTDWGRDSISQTLWIDLLRQKITNAAFSNFYVTDLRFQNEADMLKEKNFVIVKILRAEESRIQAGAVSVQHKSEQEVAGIKADFIIENNGSLEQFQTILDNIVTQVIKAHKEKKHVL